MKSLSIVKRIGYAGLAIAALLAIARYWLVADENSNASKNHPSAVTKNGLPSTTLPSSATSDPAALGRASGGGQQVISRSAHQVQASIPEFAHERDLSTLLNEVRKSENMLLQEYALFAPFELCLANRVAPSIGLLPLLDSKANLLPAVQKILQPAAVESRKSIAARCSEYSNDGHLRDSLAKELVGRGIVSRTKNLPWADENGKVADGTIESAKLLLQTIFADQYSPTIVQMLRLTIAKWSLNWVEPMLPLEYRPDAFTLSTIALEIAACRSGAQCNTGSIARDVLCAKYGECQESDVENSYRRLHSLYQVPFSVTDSLASKYQRALATKSVEEVFGR